MPLTSKGRKIHGAMTEKYGKEKGEEVFYASKNKGTIKGVDAMPKRFGGAIRDALAKGLPIGDAIGKGIDAAMPAPDPQEKKQQFFKGVKDAVAKGMTADKAIADALRGKGAR